MKPGETSAAEDEEVEETWEEEVGEEHGSDRDSGEEEPQGGDSVEKVRKLTSTQKVKVRDVPISR